MHPWFSIPPIRCAKDAMKRIILTAVALLFAANSLAALAQQFDIFHQTVNLNGIAATVQIFPSGRNDFQIHARFHSDTSPVACLSAYGDLHYELHDSSG